MNFIESSDHRHTHRNTQIQRGHCPSVCRLSSVSRVDTQTPVKCPNVWTGGVKCLWPLRLFSLMNTPHQDQESSLKHMDTTVWICPPCPLRIIICKEGVVMVTSPPVGRPRSSGHHLAVDDIIGTWETNRCSPLLVVISMSWALWVRRSWSFGAWRKNWSLTVL